MPARVDTDALIAGINAVQTLLEENPQLVNHIVFALGHSNPRLYTMQKNAEALGIRVQQLPKSQLDEWFKGVHQGVLAFKHSRPLDAWEEVRLRLIESAQNGGSPLIVLPAAIEDPRNLGAILRTSAGMGVDAIMLPAKGGAGITPTVAKAAAGSLEKIPVCRVNALDRELQLLREEGFAVVGLDGRVERTVAEYAFTGPVVAVIGGEDRGIPPHIARNCSVTLSLPIGPGAHSYNASIALALLLYEINRQQEFARLHA